MAVLTELRNRGVADVFFLVCDAIKSVFLTLDTRNCPADRSVSGATPMRCPRKLQAALWCRQGVVSSG